VLEALLLGDVTIPVSASFADDYQRLRQPKRPSKKSRIDQQFEVPNGNQYKAQYATQASNTVS